MSNFKIGDKVRVDEVIETAKYDENGNPGWARPEMDDCLGKVGTVVDITYRGFIDIHVEGQYIPWIFMPEDLELVNA